MKNSKVKNILFSLLATLFISMTVTKNAFTQTTTQNGYLYFQDNNQYLRGHSTHRLDYRSNHNAAAQINFFNKKNEILGCVRGQENSDGSKYFGLLDANYDWSYVAKTDSWVAFKINDEYKMRILANGNVGIGTNTPSQKLHVEGNVYATGYIKSMSRAYYFGDVQRLVGDNASALVYNSNNSDYSQFIMRDKENETYGKLYGSGNGANFGLVDGDGNWSYLAVKDNYTAFRINDSEKMRIRSNGRVGIGFTAPETKLEVKGIIRATSNATRNHRTEIGHTGTHGFINTYGAGDLLFRHHGSTLMRLRDNGKVVIGSVSSPTNDYKLYVEKGILTEKVRVAVKSTSDWSDYVFEQNYEVMPIAELEDYVTENKHLPNVPSAEEMVKGGLDVVTMDAKLLEKIEEAHLYIMRITG